MDLETAIQLEWSNHLLWNGELYRPSDRLLVDG
jgi:hypothetical protein